MLRIEFKRSIHNKTLLYLSLMTVVAFVMGWVLPVGIDKVQNLNYGDYLFSTYTVFTQFGFLFFSFCVASYINRDYTQKNIIFYKMFNIGSLKYTGMKILVVSVEEFGLLAVLLSMVSLIYGNWAFFMTSLVMFWVVVFHYILITSIFSLLFGNMLVAVAASIGYWILSLVLVAIGGVLRFFSIFDASNQLYDIVSRYYSYGVTNIPISYISTIIIETFCTLMITIIISTILRKRWSKLGI